ncbi:MAG: RsfS/YbeB/iojap family protein [Proteobacteria bacterium]|nr:RsfS/YbeB/iojap family protein [Pseudomonadota bacterium]
MTQGCLLWVAEYESSLGILHIQNTNTFEINDQVEDFCQTLTLLRAHSLRVIFCGDSDHVCTYQIVCIAKSSRHSRSVARGLLDAKDRLAAKLLGIEGYDYGEWIALDFGVLIVHIFDSDAYSAFKGDTLWQEYPSLWYSSDREIMDTHSTHVRV